MTNTIALWLELIGTPERAAKLLKPWTHPDPAVVLFGHKGAERVYASPIYRPALDSWDQELTTHRDIRIWARHVADGQYKGKKLLGFFSQQLELMAGGSAIRRARTSLLLDRTAEQAQPRSASDSVPPLAPASQAD